MIINPNKKCLIKSISFITIAVLLDVVGIYEQIFELSYDRNFYLSDNENTLTSYVIKNFTYLHNPKEHCQFNKNQLSIVFVIKSAGENSAQRIAIRQTWGKPQLYTNVQIRTLFMIGKAQNPQLNELIFKEAVLHKDIIQADFQDVYFNNTFKTMLSLHWAQKNCHGSNYFLLVDDDYYVSVKNLLRFIDNRACYPKYLKYNLPQTDGKLFAGHVFVYSRPPRHKWSKWYIPLSEYPYNSWPPYITGGAILLSQDYLLDLYQAALNTRFFKFDDVFLGMAAQKGNITLTHCELFHFEKQKYESPDSYKHIIASHGYENPDELEQLWNDCYNAGYA